MAEDKSVPSNIASMKSLPGQKPVAPSGGRLSVSEAEFDALCETRKEYIFEFVFAAAGAALGALPGTLALLIGYATANGVYAFKIEGLVQFGIFCAGLAVAGCMGFLALGRHRRLQALEATIRGRA